MQGDALHSCFILLLTEVLPLVVIAVIAALAFRGAARRKEPKPRKDLAQMETDLWRLVEGDPENQRRPEKSTTREPQLW